MSRQTAAPSHAPISPELGADHQHTLRHREALARLRARFKRIGDSEEARRDEGV